MGGLGPWLHRSSGAGQWPPERGSQVATVPSTPTRGQQTTVCVVAALARVPALGSSSWFVLHPGRKAKGRADRGPFLVGRATCGRETQAFTGHHEWGTPRAGLGSCLTRGSHGVATPCSAGKEGAPPGDGTFAGCRSRGRRRWGPGPVPALRRPRAASRRTPSPLRQVPSQARYRGATPVSSEEGDGSGELTGCWA